MPDKARWYNPKKHDYEEISVDDITVNTFSGQNEFRCVNPNCSVKMLLRNSPNGGFSFASFPNQASHHIDVVKCVRNSLVFDATRYCEAKFNFSSFIQGLCKDKSQSPSGRASHSSSNVPVIKNDSRPAVRGLPSFYRLICNKSKSETYNGFCIGDMFCDSENFASFESNPMGDRVLECSYYKPVPYEQAFYLNFPIDNRPFNGTLVKIKIKDRSYFFELKDKTFRNSHHVEPLIVAGEWIRTDVPNLKCISYCNITNKRQLAFLKDV